MLHYEPAGQNKNDGLPPPSGPVGCLFLCEAAPFHSHPSFLKKKLKRFVITEEVKLIELLGKHLYKFQAPVHITQRPQAESVATTERLYHV